ncbi:ABC transporter substrate-binding protein [Paenibacillus ehimensis]|uniref:Sugar ABC transporter substrate-binding protein n=1 Tax=Paenibacillus ehimensis TaxID=79264 RepID=A0ABT8VAR3_9BACL|nr:sugar ABC transporter substrate-binding protein [Paenibacillus ehimensis]MDO3678086.1 sugar ABC transporter substrate-binding protein [Paenibacillus ehimensis]
MQKYVKKTVAASLCVGLMAPTLVACTKSDSGDNKTEKVLRIATSMGYGGDNEYFRQRFTELFEFANPNIKLEFISTSDDRYMYGGRPDPKEKPKDPMDKLKEVMTGDNPPDVVMVGYDQLPELISNNMLKQLDQDIAKDKFDTSDLVPAVIEGIKKAGDGKIYALAPTFYSSAMIYNKKIFDEAGVQYPTDKMTWDQTFDLARRLTKGEGENRKYGFSFSPHNMGDDIFYATQMYTAPLDLKTFDDKGEKMTVDSDQWEKVWKTLLQLKTEKILPEPVDFSKRRNPGPNEDFNPFMDDDFLSGRVAMSIISYGQISQYTNVMKNSANIKGITPFEWDVVTVPVHQEAPEYGGNIGLEGLMGINAKAQNAEDAWKFIKFINSEEWARLKASSTYNLVSRQKYIKPKDGAEFNIKAFTTLLPAPSRDYKVYREKPGLYDVERLGSQKFQQVVQNKLQVRDALKQWQTEGDAMLQKIKENPNAQFDSMMQGG